MATVVRRYLNVLYEAEGIKQIKEAQCSGISDVINVNVKVSHNDYIAGEG
jgi:hypothetical protein